MTIKIPSGFASTWRGGASCHVGYRSCFYREIPIGGDSDALVFTDTKKVFDPQEVYGDAPNPTIL